MTTTTTEEPMWKVALNAIERLEARLSSGTLREGVKLSRPECESGCSDCFLTCAAYKIGIQVWEDELDRAGGVPVWALKHAA